MKYKEGRKKKEHSGTVGWSQQVFTFRIPEGEQRKNKVKEINNNSQTIDLGSSKNSKRI